MKDLKIENLTDDRLREIYIEMIPQKLLEINKLKLIQEQLKKAENELQLMVEKVGEFENDYFKIFTKIEKKTSVDYIELENAINEIKESYMETEDFLTTEQQEIFNKLETSMKKDIEVKKPSDKLKMLSSINPAKAEEIKKVQETKKIILKEKKSLLEEIEEQTQKASSKAN